ncbi:MAG TPA: DUF2911 domain-containing protein [Opitutaceae bacterium]
MKKYPQLVLALAVLSLPTFVFAANETAAPSEHPRVNSTGGHSPHETISGSIGGGRRDGVLLTVVYGRPYTKSPKTGEIRKIWGGLVPWGKADRLGADEATLLITPVPLEIQGQTIPAGAYTLYIVPVENGPSLLAFSSNIGKWGVPVDEAHDVARFKLEQKSLNNPVEQLTIQIVNDPATPHGGFIKISWENLEFTLPVKAQVHS